MAHAEAGRRAILAGRKPPLTITKELTMHSYYRHTGDKHHEHCRLAHDIPDTRRYRQVQRVENHVGDYQPGITILGDTGVKG